VRLKDKKIEILSVQNVKDSAGFNEEKLVPIGPPVWAYFRQLSGSEVFAAQAVQVTEEVLFIINYRTDITTRHVIRFRDVNYDITRIDTFEGYKEDLSIYAKRRG